MTEDENESKGFKVTDKRISYEEEEAGKEEKEKKTQPAPEKQEQEAQTQEPPPQPEQEPESQAPPSGSGLVGESDDQRQVGEQEGYPPLDFTQFILSLGSSAMLQLGEAPHPVDGQYHTDVEGAKQTIDILGILEEKTTGNLNQEEQNLLKNILADLRIRFVKKQSQ